MDTRDKPEYDNGKRQCFVSEYDKGMRLSTSILNHTSNVILGFIPRIHTKHPSLDTRVTPEYDNMKRMCLKPEYDNMKRMCLKPEYEHKWTLIKNLEYIETAESGVDNVVSSCEKNPNVHKTYMNFLKQRKTALDAPLHAVSSGRLLPQCAWEFY